MSLAISTLVRRTIAQFVRSEASRHLHRFTVAARQRDDSCFVNSQSGPVARTVRQSQNSSELPFEGYNLAQGIATFGACRRPEGSVRPCLREVLFARLFTTRLIVRDTLYSAGLASTLALSVPSGEGRIASGCPRLHFAIQGRCIELRKHTNYTSAGQEDSLRSTQHEIKR